MKTVVFNTKLGAMAFAYAGRDVFELVFGYKTKKEALDVLKDRLSAPDQLDSASYSSDTLFDADELRDQLTAFAAGEEIDFSAVQLNDRNLTDFQAAVRTACRGIPWGETITYGQLAEVVGRPGAARAVGSVMSSNCVPLIVPCHRVVPACGGLGGFSSPQGVAMKQRLLETERVLVGQ